NHLIRRQVVVRVDRPIVRIIRVAGIVTPGRVPISAVPVIISTADKDDTVVMASPPTAVVPLRPVSPEGLVMLTLPIPTALNLVVRSEPRARDRRIGFGCEVEVPGLKSLRVCLAMRRRPRRRGRYVVLRLQPRVGRRGDRMLRRMTRRDDRMLRVLRRMTRRDDRMLRVLCRMTRGMGRWCDCMLRTLCCVRRRGFLLWCRLVFFRPRSDGRECKTAS